MNIRESSPPSLFASVFVLGEEHKVVTFLTSSTPQGASVIRTIMPVNMLLLQYAQAAAYCKTSQVVAHDGVLSPMNVHIMGKTK